MDHVATITKIQLKVGDTELSLTVDEAKELKSLLMDLFNTSVPIQPVYVEPWWFRSHKYRPYDIWWSDVGSGVLRLSNTNTNSSG